MKKDEKEIRSKETRSHTVHNSIVSCSTQVSRDAFVVNQIEIHRCLSSMSRPSDTRCCIASNLILVLADTSFSRGTCAVPCCFGWMMFISISVGRLSMERGSPVLMCGEMRGRSMAGEEEEEDEDENEDGEAGDSGAGDAGAGGAAGGDVRGGAEEELAREEGWAVEGAYRSTTGRAAKVM